MARALTEKHRLATFQDGLVTEQTALTHSENVITAGDNMDISIKGELTRRLGVDYEAGHSVSGVAAVVENALDLAGISIYEWLNVNGYGGLNFLMIQGERYLWFYDLANDPLSGGILAEFDLTDYIIIGNKNDTVTGVFDAASLDGRLFVTTGITEPLVFEYEQDTNEIVMYTLTLRIRDFVGVEDGLDPDERPVTLSQAHEYNLMNQGWIDPVDSGVNTQVGVSGKSPIDFVEVERETCFSTPVVP